MHSEHKQFGVYNGRRKWETRMPLDSGCPEYNVKLLINLNERYKGGLSGNFRTEKYKKHISKINGWT